MAEKGALQNDYGLGIGFLPGEKIQGEAGFDVFLPTPGFGIGDFLQLNAKLALVEGTLSKWQPGISAGVLGAGFKKDVSNYHLVHAEVGEGVPFGTVAAGVYYGAGSKILWSKRGDGVDVNRFGVMGSWVSPDFVLDLPGLKKINLAVDGASGNNWFGAIAGGLVVYFTPAINIITGPVWFLDGDLYKANPSVNTDFLWTVQLDVDFDLRRSTKKT